MNKSIFTIAIATILLAFSGCVKENSTTETQLNFSFNATNLGAGLSATAANSGNVVIPGSNGSINWTGMVVNIAKVSVSAKLAGKEVAFESKELYNINPLKTDSLIGTVALTPGVYENVKVKLTMTESASHLPVLITGTYTEMSGTKIPVVIQLNQSQVLTLEMSKIEAVKGTYTAKVTFLLNELVKGLTLNDFGQTTRTGSNNSIVVTSTLNRALYEKLSVRLATIASVTLK